MATKTAAIGDVIDVTEVTVAPRGRKAELNPELVAAFEQLPAGKAIRLGLFGTVTEKDARAKVANTIRKNWNAARSTKCRISWGSGMPEVSEAVNRETGEPIVREAVKA